MALRAIGANMARYAAKAVGSTSAATTFFFLLLAGLRFATAADSDEVGHAFQNESGHGFRFQSGQGSDLIPAT